MDEYSIEEIEVAIGDATATNDSCTTGDDGRDN